MSLPIFDTQDAIPEAFRAAYEEKDGKWHPKGAPASGTGPTPEDIERLQTTLQRVRDDVKAAEKRAKEAEDARAELDRLMKAKEAGITDEEAKKWREQVYVEVRAEVQKEMDALKGDLDRALGNNRSLQLDAKVKALALQNGVVPERIDDWWALCGPHFDLDENGVPVVKDGKGKTPEQYITQDLKKGKPYLYTGTQADGGGAGGNRLPGGKGGAVSMEDIMRNPAAALTQARASEQSAA